MFIAGAAARRKTCLGNENDFQAEPTWGCVGFVGMEENKVQDLSQIMPLIRGLFSAELALTRRLPGGPWTAPVGTGATGPSAQASTVEALHLGVRRACPQTEHPQGRFQLFSRDFIQYCRKLILALV